MREAAQSFILSVKKSPNLPSFELFVPQLLRVGGAMGIKQGLKALVAIIMYMLLAAPREGQWGPCFRE
jgi:hypothetical protein